MANDIDFGCSVGGDIDVSKLFPVFIGACPGSWNNYNDIAPNNSRTVTYSLYNVYFQTLSNALEQNSIQIISIMPILFDSSGSFSNKYYNSDGNMQYILNSRNASINYHDSCFIEVQKGRTYSIDFYDFIRSNATVSVTGKFYIPSNVSDVNPPTFRVTVRNTSNVNFSLENFAGSGNSDYLCYITGYKTN